MSAASTISRRPTATSPKDSSGAVRAEALPSDEARAEGAVRAEALPSDEARAESSMNTVGVVGLGYVGLTLAVTLARKGFTVHGVDTSPAVLESLAQGRPHIFEPGVEEGVRAFLGERLHVGSALPKSGVDA